MSAEWSILTNPPLPDTPPATIAYVALRPDHGIALLDTSPEPMPDAVARVRAALSAIRFAAIYSGHLPIIHRRIAATDLATLAADLDEAFAAEPPISLGAPPGGDPAAWVSLACRVFGAEFVSLPASPVMPAPPPGPASELPGRSARRAAAPHRRLAIQAGAAGVLVFGGLYAWQAALAPPRPVPVALPLAATAHPPDPAPVAQAEPAQQSPAPPPPIPLEAPPAPPLPEHPNPRADAPAQQAEQPAPVQEASIAPDVARPPELSLETPEAPPSLPEPAPALPPALEPPASAVSNAALIARGNQMLARRDIKAARNFYERAANAGSGTAARLMGETYDPAHLAPDERGFADLVAAQIWYTRAGQLGTPAVDFEQRFRAAVHHAD